uniref:Uncharacterized protein n=1 Tax=Oryza punctata TaxID=4537 RepID=A0A0E0KPI4_ORYPU
MGGAAGASRFDGDDLGGSGGASRSACDRHGEQAQEGYLVNLGMTAAMGRGGSLPAGRTPNSEQEHNVSIRLDGQHLG